MSHQDRRDPLPTTYRFGDAKWQRPNENAADRIWTRALKRVEAAHRKYDALFTTDRDLGDETDK